MKAVCSIFLAASIMSVSLFSHAQTFQSSEKAVPLVELYTSEGCSSCPPAERWLSKLTDREDLWSSFVPIAFHVDYWDYIGWKDPYASKEYSQRQRRYAHEYGENTVYTPGMRKSGEDWRSWRFLGKPEVKNAENVGEISITVDDAGTFTASFVGNDTDNKTPLTLNVALLGIDLSSEVTRGENHGKTLEHDFVVLGISSYASGKELSWSGNLPEPSVEAPRYAIAAWVTQGQSLKPIQATGGYLASSN